MRVWTVTAEPFSLASVHNREDVEVFATMADARDTFANRMSGWDRAWPYMSDDTMVSVWLADPYADDDQFPQEYPDRVMTRGPRGGIRVENV